MSESVEVKLLRRLSNSQRFRLNQFVKENEENHRFLTHALVARAATEALGFEVSDKSVIVARKTTEVTWARKRGTYNKGGRTDRLRVVARHVRNVNAMREEEFRFVCEVLYALCMDPRLQERINFYMRGQHRRGDPRTAAQFEAIAASAAVDSTFVTTLPSLAAGGQNTYYQGASA